MTCEGATTTAAAAAAGEVFKPLTYQRLLLRLGTTSNGVYRQRWGGQINHCGASADLRPQLFESSMRSDVHSYRDGARGAKMLNYRINGEGCEGLNKHTETHAPHY